MMASVYRALDLTSISIQHGINRSKLSKTSKFMCSSIVSVMPFLAMSFMGYIATELFIASALRLAVSYLAVTPSSQNFIREIDLVSSFKNFYITDFFCQNLAYMIKNLASSLLISSISTSSFGIAGINPLYAKSIKLTVFLESADFCLVNNEGG